MTIIIIIIIIIAIVESIRSYLNEFLRYIKNKIIIISDDDGADFILVFPSRAFYDSLTTNVGTVIIPIIMMSIMTVTIIIVPKKTNLLHTNQTKVIGSLVILLRFIFFFAVLALYFLHFLKYNCNTA